MRPPSVDRLARSLADEVDLPHPLLVDVARAAIAAGDPGSAATRAHALQRLLLQPVVNATGVLLHTNLGRAPRAPLAGLASGTANDASEPGGATRYANVELDLATGERGSRHAGVGRLAASACGAEAAIVANNGAAAVLLVLAALAAGRDVLVSRGEAVEIGGGFRVPDVMAQSGARLVDVGTTNRTRRDDYARACGADTALLLKVHPSNYRIEGFTEAAGVAELATIGPPVVADIGSGLLDAACPWLPGGPPAWVQDEPAARQTLAAGAALVVFSGDKLLGGPQAGIIAGRRDLVAACARHPLARALRPGGLVLTALQDTLLAYLRRDGAAIPFWRMATTPVADLRRRAAAVASRAAGDDRRNGRDETRGDVSIAVVECASLPGAGSVSGIEIPSAGIAVPGDRRAALREATPPVIARVRDDTTVLDLRTVDPTDDAHVAAALHAALRAGTR